MIDSPFHSHATAQIRAIKDNPDDFNLQQNLSQFACQAA
jgi:hypothetical protein